MFEKEMKCSELIFTVKLKYINVENKKYIK